MKEELKELTTVVVELVSIVTRQSEHIRDVASALNQLRTEMNAQLEQLRIIAVNNDARTLDELSVVSTIHHRQTEQSVTLRRLDARLAALTRERQIEARGGSGVVAAQTSSQSELLESITRLPDGRLPGYDYHTELARQEMLDAFEAREIRQREEAGRRAALNETLVDVMQTAQTAQTAQMPLHVIDHAALTGADLPSQVVDRIIGMTRTLTADEHNAMAAYRQMLHPARESLAHHPPADPGDPVGEVIATSQRIVSMYNNVTPQSNPDNRRIEPNL